MRLDPEHGAARDYVDLFNQQDARERDQAALPQVEAEIATQPTVAATPILRKPRRRLNPLVSLLLSLGISVLMTYGIVRLFNTIIPTQVNGLPLSLILCGWVIFPVFILTLGALNPKD